MEKNDDMQVYKISKWKEAPDSIKDLYSAINAIFAGLSFIIDPKVADDKNYTLNELLAKVLNEYNELEARHQKDTGMISEYEEENRNLKSELDIKTDECDALISRVFKQDDEYTKLEAKNKEIRETDERIATENRELRTKCKYTEDVLGKMIKEVTELEKEKIDLEVRSDQSDDLRYRAAKYAWAIKTVLKKATFSPGHVAEELRYMARKSTTSKDVQERWEGYADELLGEHTKLVEENKQLKKKIEKLENALNDKKVTPRKGNIGDKIVPPTGCCGCCNICKQRDICWILND